MPAALRSKQTELPRRLPDAEALQLVSESLPADLQYLSELLPVDRLNVLAASRTNWAQVKKDGTLLNEVASIWIRELLGMSDRGVQCSRISDDSFRELYLTRPPWLQSRIEGRVANRLASALDPARDARLLLRLSLASSVYGRRLEGVQAYSIDLGLRAWAWRTWRKAPGVAAALELALILGPSQASTLVRIVRQLARDRDRKPGTGLDGRYQTYALPKKRGGERVISVPDSHLKWLQRRIACRVLEGGEIDEAAHGFRRGRSIVTNAEPHVGQPMVVNLDIKDFFPSTSRYQVWRALDYSFGEGLSRNALHLLADICCFAGGLPIGAPTSPGLANLVLRPADAALSKAAQAHDIVYTRYADDLTFSGHTDTHRIIPFVAQVLGDYGYELEPAKINIFRRGRRQIVTGLVVNEKVNVPRRVRRRLRAAVHRRSEGRQATWHDRPMGDAELLGRIAALGAVLPEEARALREQFG